MILGIYNHKVGYPHEGVWYEPTGRMANSSGPPARGLVTTVAGVVTKGRAPDGVWLQWVTAYKAHGWEILDLVWRIGSTIDGRNPACLFGGSWNLVATYNWVYNPT